MFFKLWAKVIKYTNPKFLSFPYQSFQAFCQKYPWNFILKYSKSQPTIYIQNFNITFAIPLKNQLINHSLILKHYSVAVYII